MNLSWADVLGGKILVGHHEPCTDQTGRLCGVCLAFLMLAKNWDAGLCPEWPAFASSLKVDDGPCHVSSFPFSSTHTGHYERGEGSMQVPHRTVKMCFKMLLCFVKHKTIFKTLISVIKKYCVHLV